MAKYLSGKVKNLKVGLDNYSEDKVVLDIVGIVSAKGGLKVGENLTMNADTGSISATSFIGDGSGLEGVVGAGSGVVIKDDNVLVGTAATINLGTNLVATPISAGIVTINVTPEIDLVNIGAQTLEVSGIATFKEDLQFISAGSTVAVFDVSTGSLGIGSLSPAAKLDVKGTIETDALKVVGIATIGLVTVYGATGIVSATQYYGSGINLTGIGDTEYIDSASLRVNGITTVGFITATSVWVSGIVTATTFKGAFEGALEGDVTGNVIGIATTALGLTGSPDIDVSNIVGTALSISGGITTIGFATATDVWVSGTVTATTFKGDLEGTVKTNSQPHITSLGTLNSLSVNGDLEILGVPFTRAYWDKNDVGLNTSSYVGIGTTTPLADLQVGTGITMYGNTGIISATTFKGTLEGNASSASSLSGSITIGGESFDGTSNIDLPGVNSEGDQNTTGTAAGLSSSPDIDVSNIVGTALSISGGISTVGFLTATDVWVSGTVTATTFKGALEGDVTGTVKTGAQPHITSLGTLNSLSVTGDVSIGGTLTYEDVTNIESVGLVTAREGIHVVSGVGVSIAAGGLNVTSGITTVGFLTATDVWVSGTVTATAFKGTLDGSATSAGSATNASGLTGNPSIDVSNIVGTALSISGGISTLGVTSATDLEAQNLNVSGISSVGAAITMYGATGIVSATKYYGDGSDLSGITADTFGTLTSLNVSGMATLGSVKFETVGIVTAKEPTGIVTYYGDGSNLTGLVSGITTGIGTFIASAGVGTDIDIFNHTTHDYKTADYTIHFENVETQAQKLLLMQNNTSVYTNEFAIMYSGSGPIVSIGSSVDGNNIRVLATPETGISGLTTYRWTRHVQ